MSAPAAAPTPEPQSPPVRLESGALTLSDGTNEMTLTVTEVMNTGSLQERILFAILMLMADSVITSKAIAVGHSPDALIGKVMQLVGTLGMGQGSSAAIQSLLSGQPATPKE